MFEIAEELLKRYPEHAKMRKVMHLSQACGEFLAAMQEQGRFLCERDETGHLMPTRKSFAQLLAEHFGIDLDKIEREKRAMLQELIADGSKATVKLS